MDKKHINDYDLLRIVATFLVVIGHSAYLSITVENGGVNYQLPENIAPAYTSWILNVDRYLSGWVYGFHMPLFFILSGAVYGISKNCSFDMLCKKKIKRLLIPYYIYSLGFMMPVKYLGNFYNSSTINAANISVLGGVTAGTCGSC
mgnify:FL=1